ncbi:MAG: hypothetical protein DSZ03_06450 [Sulfurimonas sp.]|nr:MAG: hypothetical protein DSZ03_06450 [Sulfurimonas sp.]
MRIAVQCTSPLLQRSLEMFLQPHLSSLKQCDVVLRDYKVDDEEPRSLYIASSDDADIKKPFSQTELTLALQKMITKEACHEAPPKQKPEAPIKTNRSLEALEGHIEQLTREYQANVMKAVRAFCET